MREHAHRAAEHGAEDQPAGPGRGGGYPGGFRHGPGDNELITQVVYNLLENATKFAAEGSTLYLGLACRGEKAVVTVRNTGNTIPAQEIPLLFERFHKSDKSRSEDKDGYGLGLLCSEDHSQPTQGTDHRHQ